MQWGAISWFVPSSHSYTAAKGQDHHTILMVGDGSFQLTAQEVCEHPGARYPRLASAGVGSSAKIHAVMTNGHVYVGTGKPDIAHWIHRVSTTPAAAPARRAPQLVRGQSTVPTAMAVKTAE